MKNAKACLKCGHETIWRVDPLCFFDREYADHIAPLPVACRMVDHPDPGLLSRPTVRKSVGRFVVYLCAECGYSEMYASAIDELATLQRGEGGSQVTPAGCSPAD
jgi:predicted nucleic-acid-binding Zn-ribbon protein